MLSLRAEEREPLLHEKNMTRADPERVRDPLGTKQNLRAFFIVLRTWFHPWFHPQAQRDGAPVTKGW